MGIPRVGVTKTDERAFAETLGVSSSGGSSKSSRPHPPSSSFSSSALSASPKMASMSLLSIPSTSTMPSSSPQSPSTSSSSSTAPPLVALSSPPSNIPFITLRSGQSPPHMMGDGGIRSDGVFPSGKEGTLSPSSVASRSAMSFKP
ncbi:hypothetical protein AALP_AA6G303100 [Arabis alpina]|uniref:Uncharacterized protein n=1 Tax=Arabis alpina TaxID=50452 RepID=A0A087GSQ0_ARAAL|nr:hypothetical protein AALP_AA6G303100 [Arabis alpina]